MVKFKAVQHGGTQLIRLKSKPLESQMWKG